MKNVNDVNYIIKKFDENSEISFDYRDYICTIFAVKEQQYENSKKSRKFNIKDYICTIFAVKEQQYENSEKSRKFSIYVELEQINSEIETFNFNTIEEALDSIVIYNHKLKDIWPQVIIVDIKLGK